MSAAI
jgi:hypothetical protein